MKRGFVAALLAPMLFLAPVAAQAGAEVFQIGISQIVEHPALDASRKGFIDYLEENGYPEGKRVAYEYKNAQNNRPVSGQIARKLVGDKKDLILTIATPSSQDVAALTKDIPILFAAITDPVAAGLVRSLFKPGGNISGTTDRSPITAQIKLILEILPSAKRLGTIYNAGEANSVARGAIAALAVDYYLLGRQTGAMAAKVLGGKEKAGDLPVEYQKDLLLHLNPGAAKKMGVQLPNVTVKRASKIIK